MTPGSIGRRYGLALFELAAEARIVEEVGVALSDLATAIESLDAGVLAPGLLSPKQREQLAATLVGGAGGDSLLGRFLGVLAVNDRLGQLPAIRDRFERLQDVAEGRVRIHIRSATALSDAERESLRKRFETITGRRVLDTSQVDPELLGGVTVEAEGRVYDGSIRTQLMRLGQRMAG